MDRKTRLGGEKIHIALLIVPSLSALPSSLFSEFHFGVFLLQKFHQKKKKFVPVWGLEKGWIFGFLNETKKNNNEE